jgi:hypothetical protein
LGVTDVDGVRHGRWMGIRSYLYQNGQMTDGGVCPEASVDPTVQCGVHG